ncbi:DUF1326 domain-containing protein [Paralimibaculum aggregatum]|uniref:DUF1326 domain-containing protein n=1 Tax=Paralimibaculum aggregatum TaxID=3036245 RepID=A0ABQ6LN15_9RHOB|nr:DUF1326 domain-containing protein [Limibaculum sp. NKW23]GMG82034.1 DUF1326 domain-containing protein [Limibaculum sp. NKW23]
METWNLEGELILNCNCTVFCPCVVSLGKHPPTEGHCQAWAGVRIDRGSFGDTDISGLNVGLMLDIPGQMARGNWTAAAYIDERASDDAFDALVKIFSGQARGTTGLFSVLVGEFLGAERQPVEFTTEGKTRRLVVGKKIKGAVVPIEGADPDSEVKVVNTGYWMGPDITIATATQGRVRDRGRVWDFDGRSAEICQIRWGNA